MVETPEDVSPHATAHEETDVNVRALNTFMICLVVSLSITGAVVFWQYRVFEKQARENDPPPSPRAGERMAVSGPVLQINELSDGLVYQARQAAAIDETAWVSKDEKLVRIPVARAMEYVAQNGLPSWKPTEPMVSTPNTQNPAERENQEP